VNWSQWTKHDGVTPPDVADREILEVKRADGAVVLLAQASYKGGSCSCCSEVRWYWCDEPEYSDVVEYRRMVV
jgi:hypothetical protein